MRCYLKNFLFLDQVTILFSRVAYLCEIISTFRRRCHLKILFSSLLPFCLAEQNHLGNFGRGLYRELSCEFILNLDRWFKRISGLNFAHNARSQ